MALPWVRLDSNIASHDKILAVLAEKPTALGYQAAFSYVCSLAYCGGHGTDGLVVFSALPFVHGTRKTAEVLARNHMWQPHPLGWTVPNWAERQQSAAVGRSISNARRVAAVKGNCVRWHGAGCSCWEAAS